MVFWTDQVLNQKPATHIHLHPILSIPSAGDIYFLDFYVSVLVLPPKKRGCEVAQISLMPGNHY
jgi:hypothetical protein